MIRALIVDDEPHARERIRSLLLRHGDIEIAGECGDGISAVTAIRDVRPQLLMLDVQMPGLDGFGVLSHLRPKDVPVTIFVTAFDEHAIRAFDVGAADYVLKPIVADRFALALERAIARVGHGATAGSPAEQIAPVLKQAGAEGLWLDRFVVEQRGRMHVVPAAAVDWIEAAGNYVRLHTGSDSHLLRISLAVLESRLDPALFLRIHRSTIVALRTVTGIRGGDHGEADVILSDGTNLRAARSRARTLRMRLKP
jgi:two-component system, LytTR family, response regulator